jgi:hypothetical protein
MGALIQYGETVAKGNVSMTLEALQQLAKDMGLHHSSDSTSQ